MAPTIYTLHLRFPTAAWKTADRCREFASAFGLGCRESLEEIPLPFTIRDDREDEARFRDALAEIFASAGPLRGILKGWGLRRTLLKRHVAIELLQSGELANCIERILALQETSPVPPPVHLSADICELRPSGGYYTLAESLGLPLTTIDRIFRTFLRPAAKTTGHARPLLLPVEITMIRVCRNGQTWKLYDLALGRWMEPKEEGAAEYLADSCRHLRKARRYETALQPFGTPEETDEDGAALVADLHLGHTGVIDYYSRPFPSGATNEMDEVLIGNWNASIGPAQHIYHLGDLTYKADTGANLAYQKRLNGRITWIRGNHDICLPGSEDQAIISYDDTRFLLIHNPKHVPEGWDGWVVHGHTHNNRLAEYPFFSGERKTINVSVEVTGYHPVPLSEIAALIRQYEAGTITGDLLLRDDG
ncbi:hypothetical protein AZH53_04690 [Methanomicrobiaceae archaeon CYW5]|uniref:metallophosphoesterase n=1 Tax=Methanovulcanius yangii TaxID=1789227 RepID=UPI0029C9B8C6|nr:metallophosphoesterase [Methanovulcanius yangii]MBT8507714.1 hypothetical protein [Methanovulcanius yangii]